MYFYFPDMPCLLIYMTCEKGELNVFFKIKLIWLFTFLLPTIIFQTALAKAVMEIQFSKLGLIPPEGSMPPSIRNTFQLLWANNGDIISRQYAGTNALKVCNANICSLKNLLLNNNIAIIFTINI